jgi:hypothetical protein
MPTAQRAGMSQASRSTSGSPRQQRHHLGTVQQQSALTPPPGDIRRHVNQQALLLVWSQMCAVLLSCSPLHLRSTNSPT